VIDVIKDWALAFIIIVGTIALCIVMVTIALGILAGVAHVTVDSWHALMKRVRS
jgi:hypothetical protein